MSSLVYLDANASEPPRPEALQALREYAVLEGNPSSIHGKGRQARAVLETAREGLSALFGAEPQNCIFTSGGTESNALAISALSADRVVLCGVTEHDAVREMPHITHTLPVLPNGVLNIERLEEKLASLSRPALVCVMLANNETGVIHPIAEIAKLCHRFHAHLHVDAVQAAGRMHTHMQDLGADSMAVSAHKIGGIKGIGALFVKASSPRQTTALTPLFKGGGQEQGRRGGTQAVALAAAFNAAAQAAHKELAHYQEMMLAHQRRLEKCVKAVGAYIVGEGAARLPNTSCIIHRFKTGGLQLMRLDVEGVCVSSGSACSSGKVAQSHVLQAMGYKEEAAHAIRVSLPWNVTHKDIERFERAYCTMVEPVV